MQTIQKFKDFLLKGDTRSVKAKLNIFYMMFIKGANILCGLLIVPLTLNYVDSDTYGVWLTLSSMIAWISFFDIGLNHGLRNRLAEAFAVGNLELGKKYVSTTYALLAIIFLPLMVILLGVAPLLNWNEILNLPNLDAASLLTAIGIIISYFCVNFILNTINVVILADQKPADAALRGLLQQLVSIAVIYLMTILTDGSLINLCIGLCIAPLLVVLLVNFTLFRHRYKAIAPSLKNVDFKVLPDLMKLGIQFFIIQIAGVIQFQLVNFLIIRYFGATDVAEYNIAYKYFSVLTMVWAIMTAPIWSAVTDAIAKNDFRWVESITKKYLMFFSLFLILAPIMLLLSEPLYQLWIGDIVTIPFALSFWVMMFNLVTMFGSIFVNVLNGAGILKTQTIVCCISPLVFLGVTYFLINAGFGVYSIMIGSIVANFNGVIIAPIQVSQLFRKHK